MQTKAEEKRKGYTCIVWVEAPITRQMLAQIEHRSTSGQDVDETGEACIEVFDIYYRFDATFLFFSPAVLFD